MKNEGALRVSMMVFPSLEFGGLQRTPVAAEMLAGVADA
jgi:hypothetical protein